MAKKKQQKRTRKFTADVYMPLVMGDWLRQTKGLKAEAKSVFLSLLIHQWDYGFFLLDEIEEIDHHALKHWEKLETRFEQIEPGKFVSLWLDEVRAFFRKQKGNAKTTKSVTPDVTPSATPKSGPNVTPQNESESDIDNDIKSEVGSELEPYGKSENYFHGPVPTDIKDLAAGLKPSGANSEKWQREIANKLTYLGYETMLEVACPFENVDGRQVDGWIDIRAVKEKDVVCIECDGRVTTRDSWAKIHAYGEIIDPAAYQYSGVILLRDPKPSDDAGVYTYGPSIMPSRMVATTTAPDLVDVYNEKTREGLIMAFRDVDVDDQWEKFKVKVASAEKFYALHDLEGLRMAFQRHLQSAPKKFIPKAKEKINIDDVNLPSYE